MTGGSTCSDPEAHDGGVYAEHNLTRANLESAGFASYGEAREAAGFARGSMRIAYSDDELLAPCAFSKLCHPFSLNSVTLGEGD
jgi:hypothetical protein